ncbi:DUF1778 domain-containing protein [Limosilactobacillus reuteri]|uniref:plasmid mobilization protein n=1 Tax=Limosilactobacillus reuteri TaxID=1598 RepID=UPI00255205FE|nr:DUF1778 domain-containing protein [Limosilactobacillus reuteri]MDL2058325.1 DUF1778 domain-containing protein [Limosilactobacillus reuteri]
MTETSILKPKTNKSKTLQIRVTPEQKKLIQKLAKQNGTSVTDLFMEAMIVYAEEKLAKIS